MSVELPLYKWQLDFAEAVQDPEVDQVAALGTRGPGKTFIVQASNIWRALQFPETDHIIFRRSEKDIIRQYEPTMRKLLNNYGGVRIPHAYSSTYKVFTVACPRGGTSRIHLAFAETVKHAEKHQGIEYATVSFDEITHFEELIPGLVGGSARGQANIKRIYTGNPGGIGHSWVKRRFINPKTRDERTVVLQPRLQDNLHQLSVDPSYARRITIGLPDWKIRQWLNGDWDANEGNYFSVPPGTIRKVNVPAWAKWFAGVDWGFWPSAFAVVWVATWRDERGRHRCHVALDMKRHKLSDPDQAREALLLEKLLPERPALRFADPQTGDKSESKNAEQTATTAFTWMKHGFNTVPATKYGRVPGWSLLRQFLAVVDGYSPDPDLPHGVMTIDPDCIATITELVEAQYEMSEGMVSGDDLDSPDHCLDCIRYILGMVYHMTYPDPEIDCLTPRRR